MISRVLLSAEFLCLQAEAPQTEFYGSARAFLSHGWLELAADSVGFWLTAEP